MLLVFVVSIIIYAFIIGILLPEKNIISYLFLGFSSYISIYVVISGVWFWIDRFSIFRAVVSTAAVGILFFVLLYFHGRRLRMAETRKYYLIPITILICVLPFVIRQFEIYGMGQDEGVYQTKAVCLLAGDNRNIFDFEEYHTLEQGEQAQYLDFLNNFSGYNNTPSYPTFHAEDQHCAAAGYFHGLPNMAALLALSASCFGLHGMKAIQILLYIAMLWLIFELTVEFHWSKMTSILLMVTTAVSPIVLWVTKSSLTEGLLTLLITMLLYFAKATENGRMERYLLLIPITTFCFFHVSAFMMMPLFNVAILILYTMRREKIYLDINKLSLLSFAVGFYMMLFVSPQYTYNNLSRIEVGNLNNENLWLLPIMYGVVTLFIQNFISKHEEINFETLHQSKYIVGLLRTVLVVSIAYWGYTVVKIAYGLGINKAIPEWLNDGYWASGNLLKVMIHTPLVANCIMGGAILVLATTEMLIFKPKIYLSAKYILLTVSLVYLVFLCNIFIRKEVYYYYYYARYLEYIVPVLTLSGGILLEKVRRTLGILMVSVGILCMLPGSIFMINNKDDSFMSTDVLESVVKVVEPESAIVFNCDYDTISNIAMDVRELSGAKIYPAFEDFGEELNYLRDQYRRVYILLSDDNVQNENISYKESYLTSSYDISNPFKPFCNVRKREITILDYTYDYPYQNFIGSMSYNRNVAGDDTSYTLKKGGIMYGPYISAEPDNYCLILDAEQSSDQEVHVTTNQGKQLIKTQILSNGQNRIYFSIDDEVVDLEFSVRNNLSTPLKITRMDLIKKSDFDNKK